MGIPNLKRHLNWLHAVLLWIAAARSVFMCLLVLIAAFMFAFYSWGSEVSVRVSGYFLEMLGVSLTAVGLLRIRSHFGQAPLRELFIGWLHRFPKWKRDVVIGVGAVSAGIAGMKARLEVWTPDKPDSPVDKRIEGILKNLQRLREAQAETENRLDALQQSHEDSRKAEAEARRNLESTLRADLESLHTDDIMMSLCGLVWLAFGLSMSTLSQEIVKWLQ